VQIAPDQTHDDHRHADKNAAQQDVTDQFIHPGLA
jgi:hypothetical protein